MHVKAAAPKAGLTTVFYTRCRSRFRDALCSAVRVTMVTSARAHSELSASPRNPKVVTACNQTRSRLVIAGTLIPAGRDLLYLVLCLCWRCTDLARAQPAERLAPKPKSRHRACTNQQQVMPTGCQCAEGDVLPALVTISAQAAAAQSQQHPQWCRHKHVCNWRDAAV